MRNRYLVYIWLRIAVIEFLGMIFVPVSYADLQVFPTRVLFEDRTRSASLTIRHRGTEPTKYRVQLVYYQMHSDGRLEFLENVPAGTQAAVEMIRYSPRQVTL